VLCSYVTMRILGLPAEDEVCKAAQQWVSNSMTRLHCMGPGIYHACNSLCRHRKSYMFDACASIKSLTNQSQILIVALHTDTE